MIAIYTEISNQLAQDSASLADAFKAADKAYQYGLAADHSGAISVQELGRVKRARTKAFSEYSKAKKKAFAL